MYSEDNQELKEAIKHAWDVARACAYDNPACSVEHVRLANWLEELLHYRQERDKGNDVMFVKDTTAGHTFKRVIRRQENQEGYSTSEVVEMIANMIPEKCFDKVAAGRSL